MYRFSIIGPGRVGGALAIALTASGHKISNIIFRKNKPTQKLIDAVGDPRLFSIEQNFRLDTDVVIIAAADHDIADAVKGLAGKIEGKPIVIHTSGSLSSSILDEFRQIGCAVGSMHPLLSISDQFVGSGSFGSAYFCVEGDQKAIAVIKEIVAHLKGRSFAIETKMKPLYHAAAVMACGHMTALIDIATSMLSDAGIPSSETKDLLFPLIKSTITNIGTTDLAEALTGSFARGDIDAVDRHINAIKENESGSELLIYLLLGERSLELARISGFDPERIEIIRKRISMEKSKLKC